MVSPDPTFKPLGVISILTVWAGLLWLLLKSKTDKSKSFSLHAARSKGWQIYYFFLFLLILPLFYLFIIRWYVPALGLPKYFAYIVLVGVSGQLVAAAVPSLHGIREKIHNLGAYLMAVTLIPLTLLVVLSRVSGAVKLFAIGGALYMVVVLASFAAGSRTMRINYLYFQAAYVAIFHIVVLLSTYLD